MWRVLLYLALLGIAATGAVWLADRPETIAVTWSGRQYTASLAVGTAIIVAAALAVALVLGLVRAVVTAPARLGRMNRERKRDKGYRALTRGIVAVGAGDVAAARRHAGEAERLLGQQPLALLLKAQAAQAAGHREGAESAFRAMLEAPETRVLGHRGLYVEAKRQGDEETARRHAEDAARIAPAIGWANDAVLEARSAEGDWKSAIASVERRTSLGLIDRAASRRQRAVLNTADAIAREAQDPDGALAAALEALRLAPGLVPAAALAGRQLSRKSDLRRAAKVLETAWRAEPHPEIAAAYLNLRSGDAAADRLRRAETLARLSSWAPESRLAIARAALDARQVARARDALQPLLAEQPTVRVCLAMAEIEEQDGHAGGLREWLARAARAPRDPAWIADGVVSETWKPVSPVTGRLDAFRWETPPTMLAGPSAIEPETRGPVEPTVPALTVATNGLVVLPGAAPTAGTPSRDDPEAVVDTPAGPMPPTAAASRPIVASPAPVGPLPVPTTPIAPTPIVPAPVLPTPILPAPIVPAPAAASLPVAANTSTAIGARGKEPAPVVFPVAHAPDDPGPDAEKPRTRFLG